MPRLEGVNGLGIHLETRGRVCIGKNVPQSLATIYKFELDDGNNLYLGADTDNKFVELILLTYQQELTYLWKSG